MSDTMPASKLQADERIVMAVASAMCGHETACRYHIAQARIAIPAYRAALGAAGYGGELTIVSGYHDPIVIIPHEGVVR